MKRVVGFFVILAVFQNSFSACSKESPLVSNQPIVVQSTLNVSSPKAFYHTLTKVLNEYKTPERRMALADSIYLVAKSKNWIPIVFGDTAVFFYKHSSTAAATIQVYGDLNGWSDTKSPQISLTNIAGTKLYWAVYKAPASTARVDYKLVVNGSWVMDPGNPRQAWGGYGPNSELALGDYVYTPYVTERATGNKGTLSANIKIHSDSLNYDINYRVYLPYGYSTSTSYPLLVTTDGQEYSDKLLGATTVVADNLLMDGLIKPLVIVFVDPRDPATSTNKRADQYVNNRKFTAFLAVELMKKLKANYSIAATPDKTAILGTSLGGINSAFTGILRPDVFGLIGIQSPAFWYYPAVQTMYADAPKAQLKIYMDTGTLYDTQENALQMKAIMESKGYPLNYAEYCEGHSWANWRARIDDVLIYFFGK
ncbi:MAG: alpha/beta hydrolase-fold protein [Bacteroidales bacterium]